MGFNSRSRQSSVSLGGTGECAPFACFRTKMLQFKTPFVPLKCSILEVTHVPIRYVGYTPVRFVYLSFIYKFRLLTLASKLIKVK